MQADLLPGERLLRWARNHERGLILTWLVGALSTLAFLVVWGVLLGGADRLADAHGERWVQRVDRCAELVERERFDEAVVQLERLDRVFPAEQIGHRLADDRERIWSLLGECYLRLERKRRCLTALERLTAFEPRNWHGHFQLASARRHFSEIEEAEGAYEAVLAIKPDHLPSVTDLATLHYEAGDFDRVIHLYENYLNNQFFAFVLLSLGTHEIKLWLPSDGRPHVFEMPVELPPGWSGACCIQSPFCRLLPGSLELVGALRVGRIQSPAIVKFDHLSETNSGRLAARETDVRICFPVPELAQAAVRARIELTGYGPFDEDLWSMVEQSYRNQVDLEGLEEARTRSFLDGWLAAGSVDK